MSIATVADSLNKFPKNDYESPILVSSADGVVTKLKMNE